MYLVLIIARCRVSLEATTTIAIATRLSQDIQGVQKHPSDRTVPSHDDSHGVADSLLVDPSATYDSDTLDGKLM